MAQATSPSAYALAKQNAELKQQLALRDQIIRQLLHAANGLANAIGDIDNALACLEAVDTGQPVEWRKWRLEPTERRR